tara:strand:+ start:9942 stop:10706 length:765 start_codon:yes stop_codon:yes gene_type:complete
MPIIGANHIVNTDISEIKIVSLVPSITELLCHLGFSKNIVACTKFCEHPESLKSNIKQIGGTKNPRTDDILALEPDIVFANKEENRKEDVLALSTALDVHVSDINSVSDFSDFVTEIGQILAIDNTASAFNAQLDTLLQSIKNLPTKNVIYLIWKKPYMAAGKGTYIDSVLEACGLNNLITQERYPELSIEEIKERHPECILLSSEPYPFNKQDIQEMKNETVTDVKLVDGELFSWYSNRIFHIESHLKALHNY